MNRTVVRKEMSICSNRAQVWAYDYKRHHKIDTAKIFLFFTVKNSRFNGANWWYHVSPVVNEKSKLWVMDGGFPAKFNSPLLVDDWLKIFSRDQKCKEIRLGENDLIKNIYREKVFPTKTPYGEFGCYYIMAPAGYWTPNILAQHMLGYDQRGRPVRVERDFITKEETYQACLETSTNPIEYALRVGHRICSSYLAKKIR